MADGTPSTARDGGAAGDTVARSEAEAAAICPFVRTLLVARPDLYDADTRTMSLGALLGFVRGHRPTPDPQATGLEEVFSFFARVNHTPFRLWLRNVFSRGDRFSLDFPGSKGDHPGSTGIYREGSGEFDAAAFARVVAHSSDGETMTRRDVAAAIVGANRHPANPGSAVDLIRSAGEFALLFNLLGTSDGAIRIADMRTLFEANRWPDGALRNLGRATAAEWRTLTREITQEAVVQVHDGTDAPGEIRRAMEEIDRVFGDPRADD